MNPRIFNTIMPALHHRWAADILGMELNKEKGPDLISPDKDAEVKFCLKSEKRGYPICWTVLEYQLAYSNGKPCFWALGVYELNKEIKNIRTVSLSILENLVKKRELYIVNWDWMYQFPPSETKGETKYSKWNNTLRYPKLKNIPEIIKTYEVEKGLVHLTQSVPIESFNIK